MVSFTVTPLTDHTGAEVLGLDTNGDLGAPSLLRHSAGYKLAGDGHDMRAIQDGIVADTTPARRAA